MALSYSGVASGQIAQSAQLLQVLNLLTGVMTDQTVTFGNTLVVKGSSANALSVGVNGTTNPVFNVVTNVASQGTGLQVTGNASTAGVTVAAISSGGNDSLLLQGVGTGIVQTTATTASATVGAFKAINSNASAVGMATMLSNLSANNAANAAELGFSMNNATPAEKQYGAIRVTSSTVTAGAEGGTMILRTIQSGTMTTVVTLSSSGLTTLANGAVINGNGLQVASSSGLSIASALTTIGVTGSASIGSSVNYWADFQSNTTFTTASSGTISQFMGFFGNIGGTVTGGGTITRLAVGWLNGASPAVNGTLSNNNTLYLGSPVNGTTVKVIDSASAATLTTAGAWTNNPSWAEGKSKITYVPDDELDNLYDWFVDGWKPARYRYDGHYWGDTCTCTKDWLKNNSCSCRPAPVHQDTEYDSFFAILDDMPPNVREIICTDAQGGISTKDMDGFLAGLILAQGRRIKALEAK